MNHVLKYEQYIQINDTHTQKQVNKVSYEKHTHH